VAAEVHGRDRHRQEEPGREARREDRLPDEVEYFAFGFGSVVGVIAAIL